MNWHYQDTTKEKSIILISKQLAYFLTFCFRGFHARVRRNQIASVVSTRGFQEIKTHPWFPRTALDISHDLQGVNMAVLSN
jgi:hypothetical protein